MIVRIEDVLGEVLQTRNIYVELFSLSPFSDISPSPSLILIVPG